MATSIFRAFESFVPFVLLTGIACSTVDSDEPSPPPNPAVGDGGEAGASGGSDVGAGGRGDQGGAGDGGHADGGRADEGSRAGGGPTEGGAGGSEVTPMACPAAGAGSTDSDGDGLLDACDPDDDNDGFPDAADPAPLDPSVPGDFSTPEKILADARVKHALEVVRGKGIVFPTYTEKTPPDISGLFNEAQGTETFLATGNGENVGTVAGTGAEFRVRASADNHVDLVGVLFRGGTRFSNTQYAGALLRGTGTAFTIYSQGKDTCEVGASLYSEYTVTISSAVQEANGDWTSKMNLYVTIQTEGVYSSACNLGGDSELAGGWQATSTVTGSKKITPTQLKYLCAGTGDGYFAGEAWSEADGSKCTCSDAFAKACTTAP